MKQPQNNELDQTVARMIRFERAPAGQFERYPGPG